MSKNVKYDFTDQIVVITGAASGIGEATAVQFAQAGATAVVCDFDEAGGKQVVEKIKTAGGKADFFKIDVSSRDEAYALKDYIVKTYGRIDVLISNAGVGPLKDENGDQYAGPPLDRIPYKEWDRQFRINLMGGVNLCTAFREVFVAQKYGKVVMTSSINAYRPSPLIPQYGSVKIGLIYFAQCYAKEMGEYNINVNAVCPGYVYTNIYAKGGMTLKKLNPVAFKDAQNPAQLVTRAGELNSVLHRQQTSEDIANGILFLASDAASEITGQVLNIDSGVVIR